MSNCPNKVSRMIRRLWPRLLFFTRCDISAEKREDKISKEAADIYFQHFRIGWWPVNLERDQLLIDALGAGRYKLLINFDQDIDWAYAAVSIGPLHTEIVRWHFPTSRWFRMPENDEQTAGNDWCVHWRPAPRPADDRVSAVAMGPFRSWEVLAGEMNNGDEQYTAAIVLQTTRTDQVTTAANSTFSLIVITDRGRNKQGFLLSPAPGNGQKGNQSKRPAYYIAYRHVQHQLHFFCYNSQEQAVIWYRYEKRGRRVYWLYGKQTIAMPGTGSTMQSVHAFRNGDAYNLATGLSQEDISLVFQLEHYEWSIRGVASNCDDPDTVTRLQYPDYLIELGTMKHRSRGKEQTDTLVPVMVKFKMPPTLRSLSARTISRHIHPIYLNNPDELFTALPQDRLVLRAVKEMMI